MHLSVVLGTTHPWPSCRACLESLVPQAHDTGAELLLGDSTGLGLPDPLPDWLRGVRAVRIDGASVFALRARAASMATGDVLALTEDHCLPAPDWCRRILDAHAALPDAPAIGGGVTNRSTGSAFDWASFLMTFAPFYPPIGAGPVPRTPPAANISVKRAVLPERELMPGELEYEIVPRLYSAGRIAYDDRILVGHEQSYGALRLLAMHFHNGRTTMGVAGPRDRDWGYRARLALEVSLAAMAANPQLAPMIPRVRRRMTALSWAHSAGEWMGLRFGAGRSPELLE